MDRVFKRARERHYLRVSTALTIGCYYLLSNYTDQRHSEKFSEYLLSHYQIEQFQIDDFKESGKIPLHVFVQSWQNISFRRKKNRDLITDNMMKIFQLIAASFTNPTNRDKQRIVSLAIQMGLNEKQAIIGFDQYHHQAHKLQ